LPSEFIREVIDMKLRHLLLVLLAAIALAFSACGDDGDEAEITPSPTLNSSAAPSPAPAAFPVSITDDNGVSVTLETAPERIVALAPSFVEVLYAIGAGDTIVAADENTDYPPEAESIPKISGFEPSVEGIASYEPDLVVIVFDPGGLQDALGQLGINTLFLASPDSIEGTFVQIELLGRAVGRSAAAKGLVGQMRAVIEGIKAKLPAGAVGPRVYHEVDNTYYSAGPGSFVHDFYATLGAQNIAESTGQAFPQLNAEAIIRADPEVIILADEFAGESADTVAARAGWSKISAVKGGRVFTIDPNIVSRPGPRLVDALEMLARLLYPEVY
jgi:iron complex transport system substrate-binding protein